MRYIAGVMMLVVAPLWADTAAGLGSGRAGLARGALCALFFARERARARDREIEGFAGRGVHGEEGLNGGVLL